MHRRHGRIVMLAILIGLMMVAVLNAGAYAREVQLAGIRLGDHAINLLDIYGQPDAVVVGPPIPAEQPEQAAPGMPDIEGAGPSDLMQPPGGIAGMMGMGGPGGLEMPGMEPGMPEMGPAMPGMAAGAPGMGPGMPPGAGIAGGAPGAQVAGAVATDYPSWATPLRVELETYDTEWIYRKGPVVMGFVLDRDGFCKVIVIAAEECDYARTALWQPHRYVKLGDNYETVISRYGYPDETQTFVSTGPGAGAQVGGGHATVSYGGSTRSASRSAILNYSDDNNIEFTLHNFEVTRIHIWE